MTVCTLSQYSLRKLWTSSSGSDQTERHLLGISKRHSLINVSVAVKDRDVLRFLWFDDVKKKSPEVVVLRFTRVIFGSSSSPFLLNATVKHHMERYEEDDPEVVKTFLRSIYVDDLNMGGDTDEEAYQMYIKSKLRLAEGGFNLRKFVTNSADLKGKYGLEKFYFY